MSELRKINRDLKRDFGLAQGDALGRARYRLAFTKQIEKRIGTIGKFSDAGLWLADVSGVHEVPKYNYDDLWNKPHWVLEQLLFAPLPEVPETKGGSYEPIWVFPYVDGQCKMPPYRGIQLFLYLCLYGPKKTISDYMSEEDKAFEREVELTKDMLWEDQTWFQHLRQSGSAAAMPTNYDKESPLIKEKAI